MIPAVLLVLMFYEYWLWLLLALVLMLLVMLVLFSSTCVGVGGASACDSSNDGGSVRVCAWAGLDVDSSCNINFRKLLENFSCSDCMIKTRTSTNQSSRTVHVVL